MRKSIDDHELDAIENATAVDVEVTDEALTVHLWDGRVLSTPIMWRPRLVHATPEHRNRWELVGSGAAIHWEDLDEDIRIKSLILGRRSEKSAAMFNKWLAAYRSGGDVRVYLSDSAPALR